MLCISCGKTTKSNSNCEHCGAALPKQGMPPYQNGPLSDVLSLISKWENGETDGNSVCSFIDRRRSIYSSILKDVDSMDISDEVRIEAAEEIQIGRIGVSGLIQALDYLRQYIQSGNNYYKEQSITLMDNSVSMVNKAMRLNWKSFQNLQSSMEEMLDLAQQTI